MYIKPKNIKSNFDQINFSNKEPFFGLPSNVKFCKKCTVSNQRPSSEVEFYHQKKTQKKTIKFKGDICEPCLIKKENEKINWKEREKELLAICDKFRNKSGQYDCIVPGSGGKDSFYASYILKHKYKMNPLTVTWAPLLPTETGQKNILNWTNSGVDNYYVRPDRKVQRLLTRIATENLLHPFQTFYLGQKLLAPKIASKLGVNLIFYGENQSAYGNDKSFLNTYKMDEVFFSINKQNKDFYLGGEKISDLKKFFLLQDRDLQNYLPEIKSNSKQNISYCFLSHFMKWHNQSNYFFAKKNSDFHTASKRIQGTYTKYVSTDDEMEYMNFYCMGIKYGIGWTTHTTAYEIRDGDLTRQEGVDLVKKFDIEYPSDHISNFLDFVSLEEKYYEKKVLKNFESPQMNKEYFDVLCDNFRSPHIWKYEKENWILKNSVYKDVSDINMNELKDWEGNKII